MDRKFMIESMKSGMEPSFNPISEEAILGRENRSFRVKRRVLGGPFKGPAEFVVHELMDENDKRSTFRSPYELGNPDVLDAHAVRQGPLSDYLQTIAETADIESVIKVIKHFIRDLTGHDFQSYTRTQEGTTDSVYRSYAAKALCTLYRHRSWEPKLFSRFKIPKTPENCNLELRDAYPLRESGIHPSMGVALYSDLRQSLGFGMSKDEANAIVSTMDEVSLRYAQTLFSSPQILALYLENPTLDNIHIQESEIEEMLPLGNGRNQNRLDIDLYVNLVLRVNEIRLLGKNAINKLFIRPEGREMRFKDWSPDKLISVITAYKDGDLNAFIFHLNAITGRHITKDQAEAALVRSDKLTLIIKNVLEDNTMTLLEHVAAFIACLEENQIWSKAYWYGKQNATSNPIHYLDKLENSLRLFDMPEHYQEYWFRLYTLSMYRLVGKERLWHDHVRLEQFEGHRITEVFRTHDALTAVKIIDDYFKEVPNLLMIRTPLSLEWSDR